MTRDARAEQPRVDRLDSPTAEPPYDEVAAADPVVIDCDRCSVRGTACGDCVVTVVLGGPPFGVPLDDDERRALEVLADAGLVPPLRMVEPVAGPLVDGL